VDGSEQVPIERARLKDRGEEIAEAWYEAEGDCPVLVASISRERLQTADPSRQLTLETLLKAAAVSNDEVESWVFAELSSEHLDGANSELSDPLPLPPPDANHLTIHVRLKPPATDAGAPPCDEEVPLEKWQAFEACWKTILGIEASIDTARLGMEGLRSEMETAFKRPLAIEEKLHALQSDVAQWNKAKSRIHYALPKLREFVHRATWALSVPERKRLEEIFKNHIEPRIGLTDVDRIREQMEHFQKDRQVLFAQGNAVAQECRGILGEIQRAVSTLQRNAAENARRKRSASREKGKHI
jgi:hypothetical protein